MPKPIAVRLALTLTAALLLPGLSSRASAAPAPRQYAPDRNFDLQHLKLDLTPDFERRTLEATAWIQLQPIALPLREVILDAVDLRVQSVTSDPPLQAWHTTTNQLVVTLAEAASPNDRVNVTVRYTAQPEDGLHFRTPAQGYRDGETHLFTQGETRSHRFWFPCYDSPNERFTSEVICHVPTGMTALSNGRLVAETSDPATGRTTFHWRQDQPHVNYLIAVVAGHFRRVEDHHGTVPLGFYVLPSEIAQAPNSFRGTREMMAFFESATGVPYPWDRYDQVCVNDFVAGGMENTTLTVLTDRTLFTEATENLESSEGLVAHELAHQWFGDLITCKDWSHIWLNESFATYYETLYTEHRHGRTEMLYEMFGRLRSLTTDPLDNRPIVRRTFADPDDMFNALTYPKGSWVLHMLRAQLGDPLYRECIRTYLVRHRLETVVTEDFNAVIEELSGRSWDQFLDQWVYHGGYPELEASFSWEEPEKLARISLAQRHKTSDEVLLFRLPLVLRFKSADFQIDRAITLTDSEEDCFVPLPAAPTTVRIDPDLTVLAKIRVKLPQAMTEAQLRDDSDPVGQWLALEQLAQRKDQATIDLIRTTLNEATFHGTRIEAARALKSIHTPEALTALLASSDQPDARVRRQVVEALGGFYADTAREALTRIAASESNPRIVAAALQGLAGYPSADVTPLILRCLDSESYHDELAIAALRACRRQADSQLLAPVLAWLSDPAFERSSDAVAEGLTTLGELGRQLEDRNEVRRWITGHVDNPRKRVRLAAIRSLGTLGDPQATAVLERFTSLPRTAPERDAADQAVRRIGEPRVTFPDHQQLRDEVLTLRRAQEDLARQVRELERRASAREE